MNGNQIKFECRMSDKDKQMLKDLSEKHKMSMSDVVRRLIRKSYQEILLENFDKVSSISAH